jgi:ArsR family transcriptional regulator
MLRTARTRLGDLLNVEIRRGELESLPIEDRSLDAAFLVLVLPYVAEPAQIIREAVRALRPGGRLLLTDLMPHERSEYRQTLGHQWQGFGEEQVLGWFQAAGLEDPRYRALPPEPSAKGPRLFTAVGVRG